MPPRKDVRTPSDNLRINEFREALTDLTTVLQQQLKANTSQREIMDRVNRLVKLMMLKPQM